MRFLVAKIDFGIIYTKRYFRLIFLLNAEMPKDHFTGWSLRVFWNCLRIFTTVDKSDSDPILIWSFDVGSKKQVGSRSLKLKATNAYFPRISGQIKGKVPVCSMKHLENWQPIHKSAFQCVNWCIELWSFQLNIYASFFFRFRIFFLAAMIQRCFWSKNPLTPRHEWKGIPVIFWGS